MFFRLNSAAIVGLDCEPVDIEVDINKGQTNFGIVGLPDASIKESKERIYSAIKNSGFTYPYNFRVLVNLAPAGLQKEGALYDVPMAVGVIGASMNKPFNLDNAILIGELALDGAIRHVTGILPLSIYAKKRGLSSIFVPEEDAPEAAMVDNGPAIYPLKNLKQLINHISGLEQIEPYKKIIDEEQEQFVTHELDMALVKGQSFAKRALEIAAAGGHNILMNGPPGSGKTLLARTLPSILPPLAREESLEVTKIFSIAGLLRREYVRVRPFRAPHHTISNVALVGGGRLPKPGEISLAHRGILFLDEFSEFPRQVLEAMRQPLEDGTVTISRAQGTLTFPARFILVASQNPCPCGYATDPEEPCTCTASQINQYQKKVSGPILDRIDLHVEVPRVKFSELTSVEMAEPSKKIRDRVCGARQIQQTRFAGTRIHTNGEMTNAEIKEYCKINIATLDILRAATTRMRLSARAYNRILKISRTIADLDNKIDISEEHVAEALQFRAKES